MKWALILPRQTLAWRILDSQARVQLTAEDALWMEILP